MTLKTYLLLLLSICSIFVSAQREEKKISAIHTESVTSLAVSFDGGRALTGGADARANLWNTKMGSKLKGFGAQDKHITDVKFNSDETLFATSSKNMTIIVWDGATQKPKKILKETAEVLAIDFFPFNNNIVSVDATGIVKLWDGINGKVLNENLVVLADKNIINAAVQFSHDGNILAIHVNEQIYVYQYATLKLISKFAAAKNKISLHSFDISCDGKWLVFKNLENQLSLVPTTEGAAVQQLSGDFTNESFVAFAQNSQALFLGTNQGKVQVYNIATKRIVKDFAAHDGAVIDGGLSLDGNVLVTVGSDFALKRWDVSEFNFSFCQEPEACSRKAAISSFVINDENQNGLLDVGEKVSLNVTLKNLENLVLYDAVLKLNAEPTLEGLDFPSAVFAGNLLGNATKTINIPLTTTDKLTSGSTLLTVDVQCMGAKLASKTLSLQAGSSVNAGLTVSNVKFFSPSGKVEKGEPITMSLSLENVTRIAAENVLLTYKFPAGISAIEKTKETIVRIAPTGTAVASVQFLVDKNFEGDKFILGFELSGVAYSNADAIKPELILKQNIGTQQDMLAMIERNVVETTRGSLTISRPEIPLSNVDASRYVALIIGIDNYEGSWNKLNNAVRDAKAVEELMKKSYNFSVVKTLFDKAATRQAIISELEWLVANLKPTDNLLIYYSGHGDFKETLNRGFWVPVDATTTSTSNFISNPDLQTFLASIKAKHTLLVSDACFSGDIFRSSSANAEKNVNEKYYNRVNSLASRQALTSGGIEPVMDGGRDGHSVFAYYFLKALKENTMKFMDAEQLFDAIKIPIVNNSNQAPKFSHIKNTGDEGGEFIFFKK